jgi:hypothetical protein
VVDDFAVYEIGIDAPAGLVLATLRDVAAYPRWQNGIAAVEVLGVDECGLAREMRMVVRMMGMSAGLRLALTHDELGMRWSLVDGDFVTRDDVEYRVVERDGRSELRLRQRLSFKVALPEALTRPMIERTIRGTMTALKRRVESAR